MGGYLFTVSWSDTLSCLTRAKVVAILWVWIYFLMPLKTPGKDPLRSGPLQTVSDPSRSDILWLYLVYLEEMGLFHPFQCQGEMRYMTLQVEYPLENPNKLHPARKCRFCSC